MGLFPVEMNVKVEADPQTCFETAVARSEPGRIAIRAKASCSNCSVLISWVRDSVTQDSAVKAIALQNRQLFALGNLLC